MANIPPSGYTVVLEGLHHAQAIRIIVTTPIERCNLSIPLKDPDYPGYKIVSDQGDTHIKNYRIYTLHP